MIEKLFEKDPITYEHIGSVIQVLTSSNDKIVKHFKNMVNSFILDDYYDKGTQEKDLDICFNLLEEFPNEWFQGFIEGAYSFYPARFKHMIVLLCQHSKAEVLPDIWWEFLHYYENFNIKIFAYFNNHKLSEGFLRIADNFEILHELRRQ